MKRPVLGYFMQKSDHLDLNLSSLRRVGFRVITVHRLYHGRQHSSCTTGNLNCRQPWPHVNVAVRALLPVGLLPHPIMPRSERRFSILIRLDSRGASRKCCAIIKVFSWLDRQIYLNSSVQKSRSPAQAQLEFIVRTVVQVLAGTPLVAARYRPRLSDLHAIQLNLRHIRHCLRSSV